MFTLGYLYSKALKKARYRAIKNCEIDPTAAVESGSNLSNVILSKHSFCGYDTSINNCDIGPYCSIANQVRIGGVAHPAHFVSTSPVFLSHKDSISTKLGKHEFLPILKTTICADVWIGEGAFVKAGVSIGVGAIIGMGAVVTKDVLPYAVMAGNPARLIRFRFDEKIITRLLTSQWWNLPESQLQKVGMFADRPELFLSKLGF